MWEFDVAVTTHELLQQGVTAAAYVLVQVEAPNYTEAELVACQMAYCVGYVTDCLIRI